MQNPFEDVMELDKLSPPKPISNNANRIDSDNDSLEPPFEIHGIGAVNAGPDESTSPPHSPSQPISIPPPFPPPPLEPSQVQQQVQQSPLQTRLDHANAASILFHHPLESSLHRSTSLNYAPGNVGNEAISMDSVLNTNTVVGANESSFPPQIQIQQPIHAEQQETRDIYDYHSSSSSDDGEAPHSIQFDQQQQQHMNGSPDRHPLIPTNSLSPGRSSNIPLQGYDLSRLSPLRLGKNREDTARNKPLII